MNTLQYEVKLIPVKYKRETHNIFKLSDDTLQGLVNKIETFLDRELHDVDYILANFNNNLYIFQSSFGSFGYTKVNIKYHPLSVLF